MPDGGEIIQRWGRFAIASIIGGGIGDGLYQLGSVFYQKVTGQQMTDVNFLSVSILLISVLIGFSFIVGIYVHLIKVWE